MFVTFADICHVQLSVPPSAMFRGLFLVVLLAIVTVCVSEDEKPSEPIDKAMDDAHEKGGGFSGGGNTIAGALRVIRFGRGRGSVSVGGSTDTKGENPSVHVGVKIRF